MVNSNEAVQWCTEVAKPITVDFSKIRVRKLELLQPYMSTALWMTSERLIHVKRLSVFQLANINAFLVSLNK